MGRSRIWKLIPLSALALEEEPESVMSHHFIMAFIMLIVLASLFAMAKKDDRKKMFKLIIFPVALMIGLGLFFLGYALLMSHALK